MSATDVSNPGDAIEDFQLAIEQRDEEEQERRRNVETRRRMERAKSRGLGTMELSVNYPRPGQDSEVVPFERLSIDEADAILDELDEMQSEGDVSRREVREFVTGTLEEYCVDPTKDKEHWAQELTYGDAMGLVRNVAFGGNPPNA